VEVDHSLAAARGSEAEQEKRIVSIGPSDMNENSLGSSIIPFLGIGIACYRKIEICDIGVRIVHPEIGTRSAAK
jgi:hypothetical protein